MKLFNATQNKLISEDVRVAGSFFQRFLGLMFRLHMRNKEVLVFYKAPSIHMFFMRFAIDVVFLNKDMRVIKVVRSLKPWYITYCTKSYCTLEMSANSAENNLRLGDLLEISN